MTDFRNPRNKGRSLPPSFGGSISGLITRGASSIVEEEVSAPSRRGSSGQKGTAVDLSAEVSGRTKSGITGRVNVDGGGSKDKHGTSGGGTLGAAIGYEDKKYKVEAQGDIGGSFFLPSDDLKKFGINNASNISDAQLRKLSASIKDVTGSGAQDELSLSVTPRNNFKDGVDGAMIRYKIKF
jgi:hypothetical protein